MPLCRSCGATVIWARTIAGPMMPVDVTPHPDGNLVLANGLLIVDASAAPPRYRSHFATCPAAGQYRRRPVRAG